MRQHAVPKLKLSIFPGFWSSVYFLDSGAQYISWILELSIFPGFWS
jgi:hypothetical protein